MLSQSVIYVYQTLHLSYKVLLGSLTDGVEPHPYF